MTEQDLIDKWKSECREIADVLLEVSDKVFPELESMTEASSAMCEIQGQIFARMCNLGYIVGRFHSEEVED